MVRRMPPGRPRSGITLTEILISIMILGVGLVSLATLFPLGLLRLREAARFSRSSYLTQSANADLSVHSLFDKTTFLDFRSPWFNVTTGGGAASFVVGFDPWVQDTPGYNTANGTFVDPYTGTIGAFRGYGGNSLPYGNPNKYYQTMDAAGNLTGGSTVGTPFDGGSPGLPVAYDPLWRYQTGTYWGTAGVSEARFGSAIGVATAGGTAVVRNDPNPTLSVGGGSQAQASAHGLQRLTNFNPALTYPNAPPAGLPMLYGADTVPNIFVSPEDIVFQTKSPGNDVSTVVPDLSAAINPNGTANVVNDWRFSWMFTGVQADPNNPQVFEGDIVVFENRQFGFDPVNSLVTGELVVEGVFGYGQNFLSPGNAVSYAAAASRSVLLRWPSNMPDPDVRVGGWIADVTYDRQQIVGMSRLNDGVANGESFPYQRCYWYQVAKKTPAAADPWAASYRAMTVYVSTPLRAQTLFDTKTGQPYHVNTALVAPSVVNVFSKTISQ